MTTTDHAAASPTVATEDDLCSDCFERLDEHCTYCGECFCEAEECQDDEEV